MIEAPHKSTVVFTARSTGILLSAICTTVDFERISEVAS